MKKTLLTEQQAFLKSQVNALAVLQRLAAKQFINVSGMADELQRIQLNLQSQFSRTKPQQRGRRRA